MRSLIDTSLIAALQPKTGLDPILSPGGGIGGGHMNIPSQPFVWGQGGARLSPEQLDLERNMAAGLVQEGTSGAPIGHITQGMNRVAQALLGGFEMRDIRHQDKEAQTADQAVVDAIMGGGASAVSAGLGSRNPQIARAAQMVWKQQHPDPVAPHYWETNNGSLGVIGPDGSPRIAYEDPTPKINWIQADNGDGTKSLIPVGPNGPIGQMGGGDPASSGMGAGIPSGSPLAGSSNSKVIGGKQYWNIGGEWYDNPEGR